MRCGIRWDGRGRPRPARVAALKLAAFAAAATGVELLRSRPIDMLKIARPFVDGAGRAGHDRAVLSMVVRLGAVFGLQVVAQGIDREDQRAALAELGCELGQGYLLGRPLPLGATVAA